MPLASYLLYQTGYVPNSDVKAQLRCFEMINKAVSRTNKALAAGDESKRPELRQLQSVRDLVKDLAGSYNWRKANNFWQYWDKNKKQALAIAAPDDDYLSGIEALEDGRYYSD